MKTLVLCPRAEEFEAAREELHRNWRSSTPGTQLFYPIEEFTEADVVLGIGGQGKVNFALHTLHALERYPRLESVICVGAAGALDTKIRLQSVVVANSIFEYDVLSHFQNRHGVTHKIETLPREVLAELQENKNFDLHLGSIASGDQDVFDPQARSALFAKSQCLAVAWEGAGGARASRFHKKRYFEIRGITDRADHFVLESYQKNLPGALRNAAQVARSLIALLK